MPYADRSLFPTTRKRAAVVGALAVLLLCNATLLILLLTGELDLSIKQAADQSVAGPVVDGSPVVGTEDAPRSDATPKPITSDAPAVRPVVSPVASKPNAVPRVDPENVEQTSVDPPKADPDDALPKFFGL